MTYVERIMKQIKKISKPQMKYMVSLFMALAAFRGRGTMENLSRYGAGSVRRIARWSERDFDFVHLNLSMLDEAGILEHQVIAAIDCSFLKKSGKLTWGVGKFYNGSASRTERGMEASTLALVDVTEHTAYALDVRQTPTKMSQGKSRTDFYVQQVKDLAEELKKYTNHVVADGYYGKEKVVNGLEEVGLHIISKLRKDANLRYLYEGPKRKGRGRPKLYDGKVDFSDLSRMEKMESSKEGESWYTAVLNHPHMKRNLRVVVIVKKGKRRQSIFFSSDTTLDPHRLVKWYAARFQIEFIFRDAKQFVGFGEAQVRGQKKLSFFLMASLSSLNLLRLEDRQHQGASPRVISINAWKCRKHNQMLLRRISFDLDIPLNRIKLHPNYSSLCDFGLKAA